MIVRNTLHLLTHYGMEKSLARKLIRMGDLPEELSDQQLENLALLVKHARLNDPLCEWMLAPFLNRDCETVRRMESIPDRYGFPAEARRRYFARPMEWHRDIGDWEIPERALRLITQDEALIHEILVSSFIAGAYQRPEAFEHTCRKLSLINTDQTAMDALLKDNYTELFSSYTHAAHCVDLLMKIAGREAALELLSKYPMMPRAIMSFDWNIFREISREEFEGLFR